MNKASFDKNLTKSEFTNDFKYSNELRLLNNRQVNIRTVEFIQSIKNNLFLLLTISIFITSSCKKDDSSVTLTGNWVNKYEFKGVARNCANTFVINDKAYIIGGYSSYKPYYHTDVWEYDPLNTAWVRKDSFPGIGRIDAISFSINNKGYYGLGYNTDNGDLLNDFYEYNPLTNEWTELKPFKGSARRGAVGFCVLGKGYVATGFDGNYLNDMWEYVPETDEWIEKVGTGSFPGSKRMNALTFVIGNKVYLVTGKSNSFLNDLWEYDATADTWVSKRKIADVSDDSYDDSYSLLRESGSALVINDKAYITLGAYNSILNDTWEYEPITDLWTRKSYFEGTARTRASSFSVANRGFILLGSNGSSYFSDIWEFMPDEESNDLD